MSSVVTSPSHCRWSGLSALNDNGQSAKCLASSLYESLKTLYASSDIRIGVAGKLSYKLEEVQREPALCGVLHLVGPYIHFYKLCIPTGYGSLQFLRYNDDIKELWTRNPGPKIVMESSNNSPKCNCPWVISSVWCRHNPTLDKTFHPSKHKCNLFQLCRWIESITILVCLIHRRSNGV